MLHHLVNGVDLDLALLVALEGKADRHVLGGFHEEWSIFVARGGRLSRQATEQLLEVESSVWIGLAEFLLDFFFVDGGILLYLAEAGQKADGLNDLLLLQGNHAAGPCGCDTCSCSGSGSGSCAGSCSGSGAAAAETCSACTAALAGRNIRHAAQGNHGCAISAFAATRTRSLSSCN